MRTGPQVTWGDLFLQLLRGYTPTAVLAGTGVKLPLGAAEESPP